MVEARTVAIAAATAVDVRRRAAGHRAVADLPTAVDLPTVVDRTAEDMGGKTTLDFLPA
jgi:hypothetical protein